MQFADSFTGVQGYIRIGHMHGKIDDGGGGNVYNRVIRLFCTGKRLIAVTYSFSDSPNYSIV